MGVNTELPMLWKYVGGACCFVPWKHQVLKSFVLTHYFLLHDDKDPVELFLILPLTTMTLHHVGNGLFKLLQAVHHRLIAVVLVSQLSYDC